MLLEKLLKPLRIGKGLLCLLAMFVMLLAPQVAWATVYTTNTLAGPNSGEAKYTWSLKDNNRAFNVIPGYYADVTESSDPYGLAIVVDSWAGCEIRGVFGPGSTSQDVAEIIYKVEISGVTDNSNIAVKLKREGSDDVNFMPSTIAGEFYLPQSVVWGSTDELYINISKSCTVKGISFYTSIISSSTTYSFQGNPISNGPIQDAVQEDQTIAINAFNYQGYYYPLYVNGSTNTSTNITYSSSDETVASVATDGSVNIKKVGKTTIIATVQNDNENLTFGYVLAVSFPAPTVTPDGGNQLASANITFGYEGATNMPDFKYKWDDGDPVTYAQIRPTVQTGTLTAWVEVTPTGRAAIKSEETTVEFAAIAGTSYGLRVFGMPVTSANCDNVMGDEREVHQVTYDVDSHKLTLNGISLEGNIVSTSDNPLTVYLNGSNSLTFSPGSDRYAFIGNNGALKFETSTDNPGDLTIHGTCYLGEMSTGWSSESTPIWENGFAEENAKGYGWWAYSNCDYMTLYTNKSYDLWIDNTQFCDALLSHYGGVEYKPGSKRLELRAPGMYDYDFNPHSFTSKLPELTVTVNGEVTMHSFRFEPTTNVTEGTLTIDSYDEYSNKLTLKNTPNGSGVITGFSNLSVGDKITLDYAIKVAETSVTNKNAANVLNDDNSTVSFDAATNTLKLNNATIGSATAGGNIIAENQGNLTLEIAGTNTINGFVSGNNSKLTIVKATNTTSPSLTVDYAESPVMGFAEVLLGDGLYMNPYKDNALLPNVYYNYGYTTPSGVVPDRVVFNGTQQSNPATASIWIGETEVRNDGSFVGFNNVTFNKDAKTLTLTNATIGSATGGFDIVSGLDELTIELVNQDKSENTIYGSIVSLNASATLKFKGTGKLTINSTNPVSGFSGTPTGVSDCNLVYINYGNQAVVKTLSAPYIYLSETENRSIVFASEDFGMFDAGESSGVTIKYTISYPGEEGDPELVEYDYYSQEGVPFDGPCTITAFVAYQGKQSATTEAKYFGLQTNPVTVAVGETIDVPAILPEYDKDELAFVFESDNSNIATVSDGQITGVAAGTTAIRCHIPNGETTVSYSILNDGGFLDELEVTVLKDPKFSFVYSESSAISDGGSKYYTYGEENTLPVLKRWDDDEKAYVTDLSGFTVTYTSSDENVATISNTGQITIVGGGWAEIKAVSQETDVYAADSTWFTVEVKPADPDVSLSEGAYFTGQKLTLTRVGLSGDLYYSYGSKDASERTAYDGEISLPAGTYDFYPYTRCGTDDKNIWSYGNAHRMLYVFDEPTISKAAGEYKGDIDVEITGLPQNASVTTYYYFGDDDENPELHTYTAGDKITVRESTKLNVYLYVEGDSGKKHKTEIIVRQYVIKDITLAVTADDFHNHWMTYHNANGNVALPEGIGAFVATGVGDGVVNVSQIKYIPRNEAVLLNDQTTTTTDNESVEGNLLKHADEAVDADNAVIYGLYNGTFMRVSGTIPAGKNYLYLELAQAQQPQAPQLTIVFDGGSTGINDVRSKKADVRGDFYDLQGRKVEKPSKKGLYIKNGSKVVVK